MEQQEPHVGSLVLVAVLAFVVPLLLGRVRKLRIPIAAGEILAGIIVGKSGLGLVHMDATLRLFNFLGLASLMFLSGMEIDPGALLGAGAKRPEGRAAWLARLHHPLGVPAVIFALSLWGAHRFADMLAGRGLVSEPLFLTMIIATCGVTIIMPVLKDRKLFGDPFGQVLFNTALLGDILPLLGLSVLVTQKVKGSAWEALWVLALVAASVAVYFAGKALQRFRLMEGLTEGTAQISVRAAFALMLLFLVLAESVGVEAILGAFVAGLVLSALARQEREAITHKLDPLGFGFLIPVFFVMVGVEFDLRALLSDSSALLLVPILYVGTLVVKAAPAALLWLWYPSRKTLAGMVLLTTQMSVTIAASSIAYKVGAYGSSIHAAVILVAILTAMSGPVIFNKLLGEPEAVPERNGLVLAGMNRLALLLGGRLMSQGYQVAAVDSHPDRVQEFAEAGLTAVQADPASEYGLELAGADRAGVLLAVTEDEERNLKAARVGRERFKIPRALLLASSAKMMAEARREGFEVINPDLSTVSLVENLLHRPGATALLENGEEELQLADFVLTGGSLVGLPLRSAALPAQVLVVSIQRGREKIVPHGNTVLQRGDRLTVVGPGSSLGALGEMVQWQ